MLLEISRDFFFIIRILKRLERAIRRHIESFGGRYELRSLSKLMKLWKFKAWKRNE